MKTPYMTAAQLAKVRRLIRTDCQNFDKEHTECYALDEGGGCACAQHLSFSLLCRYFKKAVLPLDPKLEQDLLGRRGRKTCVRCGEIFTPGSNRAKYCPACSEKADRERKARYLRKRRGGM